MLNKAHLLCIHCHSVFRFLDLNVYYFYPISPVFLFITLAHKWTVAFSMFSLFFFSLMGLNTKWVGQLRVVIISMSPNERDSIE